MLSRQRGFSLVEAMITLSILALLMFTALPSYRDKVSRVRRAIAWAELGEVAVRQEQFFIARRRYATSLLELGYPSSPYLIDSEGNAIPSGRGEEGIYRVELEPQDGSYTLYAAPIGAGAPCGVLSMDVRGVKGAMGNAVDCW